VIILKVKPSIIQLPLYFDNATESETANTCDYVPLYVTRDNYRARQHLVVPMKTRMGGSGVSPTAYLIDSYRSMRVLLNGARQNKGIKRIIENSATRYCWYSALRPMIGSILK
jgi:hypothetical protein